MLLWLRSISCYLFFSFYNFTFSWMHVHLNWNFIVWIRKKNHSLSGYMKVVEKYHKYMTCWNENINIYIFFVLNAICYWLEILFIFSHCIAYLFMYSCDIIAKTINYFVILQIKSILIFLYVFAFIQQHRKWYLNFKRKICCVFHSPFKSL